MVYVDGMIGRTALSDDKWNNYICTFRLMVATACDCEEYGCGSMALHWLSIRRVLRTPALSPELYVSNKNALKCFIYFIYHPTMCL